MVLGLASFFASAGSAILKSLVDSISTGFDNAISAAKTKLATFKSLFPNSPAKAGPFMELPYWGDVIPGPIEDALKTTDPLVSKLTSTLSKLKDPFDFLVVDPIASMSAGFNKISNVAKNSSNQSNVNNAITIGPNSLSNDMDLQKVFIQFQKWSRLQGLQRGYIS